MTQSKLILLLKTFKKSEWRRFKEFLASPYFNKRTDLIAFFSYIANIHPDFSEKKLNKTTVFKKLYPNQIYDDKQMRYLMNYTLKAAEQFLGQQKITELSLMNNYILEALVDKNLEKHSKRYFDKIEENQEEIQEKSVIYYYSKYKLADTANKHFNNQDLRKDDSNLKLASENLDLFYFYNKLKYSCEMLNRQKVFSTKYDLVFTNLLHEYLEKRNIQKEPLIAIYFQIFVLQSKAYATENFEVLKGLIQKYNLVIPSIEKQHIYSYAINYCGRQIKFNNNALYYVDQCLTLYLEGIQQEFLFVNGHLSPWNFKNVVKLAVNLKRFDWTAKFIQTYYKKLAPEFQEDALHYNLADLAYRRKNYKDAQYHLLRVQYSDVFYTLGAKTMLLKIYYENNEIESLFSLIASFSIYLRRNKQVSNNFRETYLNFTMLLHQIIRANKLKIPSIIDKINKTALVTNRSWLLQICQEL
ncbi:MAG: hypothetical protein AB8G86_13510 [Saprospiraceae bacterium]